MNDLKNLVLNNEVPTSVEPFSMESSKFNIMCQNKKIRRIAVVIDVAALSTVVKGLDL